MDVGVLIDLEWIEIVQLVQAQQTRFPLVAVIGLAFFDQQLTADDPVAGDGIALELDAGDGKRLALIDVDIEVTGCLASSIVGSARR